MPDKCSVVGCKGNYRHGPRVHVFSFPKEEELKHKWVTAIKRKDFVPTKYTKVCERHFRKSEILRKVTEIDPRTGKKLTTPLKFLKLLPDAVPSLRILPSIKLSTEKSGQKRRGRTRKKLNNDALKEVLSRSQHISVNPESHMSDGTLVDLPPLATLEWDSEDDGWPQDDSDDNVENDGNQIDNSGTTIAENNDDHIDSVETNLGALFIWKSEAIRLLIELFKSHKDLFKCGYIGRKEEWSKIAQSMLDHGFVVTGDMCEEKWHSLFSVYKEYIEKNRTLPHGDKWEHYDQFQELYWNEITSILDLQTKEMLDVGVQTDSESAYYTALECEPVCSSTINSTTLFADSNGASTNEHIQRSDNLGTEDSLLHLLKEKHQSDSHWQLQMKELVLKNTEVQEQTNKILNRLVEVLVASIQQH